jgi:hydrogenase maturation protein HypF
MRQSFSDSDPCSPGQASPATRLKIAARGAVQGVGLRPFVYRLATELGLHGWVNNSSQGVLLEVEGPRAEVEAFLRRFDAEKPPRSFFQSVQATWLDPAGHTRFEIRESQVAGDKLALVLPDIATCPDCLRDIFDPSNRRFHYPFTNCTHCGPRFSIIESLPYDRANTSMKKFAMCPECQDEYNSPRDRRFHAQPNACPRCGPHLELWDAAGGPLAKRDEALTRAAVFVREGKILALKGIGGFQLMVDARNPEAVSRLRARKKRQEKPFALMFASLAAVRCECRVSGLEERLLLSPESPIVLLERDSKIQHQQSEIAAPVAPGNPNLGVMLPYTPLHHLFMGELGFSVVATSGNRSDEPICIDEREALTRLGGIADVFLAHNRPIARPVDDSVASILLGRQLLLRRARGYAPLPILIHSPAAANDAASVSAVGAGGGVLRAACCVGNSQSVLAVGAHLKNTVALAVGPQVFLSQHIGDLETTEAYETFLRVIADFQRLYDARPSVIAMDLHPDYLSTKFATDLLAQASRPADDGSAASLSSNPAVSQPSTASGGQAEHTQHAIRNTSAHRVQHHLAHVLACMAENEVQAPALGVAWDGAGYGPDGTVWGGEFFLVSQASNDRVAHFRQFRLPGGEKAMREPRRTALALLYEIFGPSVFEDGGGLPASNFGAAQLTALKSMLQSGVNCPWTSSVGRLFDAVAALIGLRQHNHFEGQAAMELEFALAGAACEEAYPLAIAAAGHPPGNGAIVVDWEPMVRALLADLRRERAAAEISAKFHNALIESLVSVARRVGEPRVALSGGCFQNRYLTERAVKRLRQEGFDPYWHQRVPPNDGGIALGQIVAALEGRQ